jgi:GMP synthase (glutamine-hydrolysing)
MNPLPVAILDFGSQVTQLIARRTREIGIYSEIVAPDIRAAELLSRGVQALILSGSPYSVYDENSPMPDRGIFNLGMPWH